MRLTAIVILAFILFQCGHTESTSIEIIVKDNNFIIENELIPSDSVEQVLKQKKKSFGDRQPTIILKVASDTKRGKLADLETILRRLNFKKIHYLELDNSKSS